MSDDVSSALQLIATQLGMNVGELTVPAAPAVRTPTFREYIAELRTAVPRTTAKAYEPYWRVVEKAWGERALDEPTTTEINQLVQEHRSRAVVRRNSRDGRGAATHMVSAIRCIYRHAHQDGLVARNPAARADKPRKVPSSRHALRREQVMEMAHVASTTGNDTELDALITRLHLESACRRSGALGVKIPDLDPQDCLVRLREKGGTVRWQPISPLLMSRLLEHVESRGGERATSQVLRYRSGRPITSRRYDYLTARIREHLPWAERLGVSIHWVRHTTLTYVEREFGKAVAQAFAGHAEGGGHGSTSIYTTASIVEVAEALAALTGQPHPLAREVRHPLAPRGDGGRTV